MHNPELNRRDFHKLTVAAMSGAMAGTVIGCAGEQDGAKKPAETAKADLHVCRGLNACKGQGADGKNACAGQGTCASAATHHECATHNKCKGQGGCGSDASFNACAGKGGCHVPLMDSAWETARKHFEGEMKKANKPVGPAPAKAKPPETKAEDKADPFNDPQNKPAATENSTEKPVDKPTQP